MDFLSKVFYLNLDLVPFISQRLYRLLSVHRGRLWGDWLFSLEAFGKEAPDQDGSLVYQVSYQELLYLVSAIRNPHKKLPEMRRTVIPEYLDHLVDSVDWNNYRVVGFTSTFQQNAASFALARRIKQKYPHIITLFGGANFDGEMGMEYVRQVAAIDYAVIGEGDYAFPEFLIAVQESRDPLEIAGVVGRRDGKVVKSSSIRPLMRQMDDIPTPNYDHFYSRRDTIQLGENETWRENPLPYESSRGCWWGAKHHCTFCGLNANGMTYRAKSPERVLEELNELTAKYGTFDFSAVDNIVDPRYFKTLFSKIRESEVDYTFFYEVKANLSRDQLRDLSMSGVKRIQPGIESLSSNVLELMRKGVKASQKPQFATLVDVL